MEKLERPLRIDYSFDRIRINSKQSYWDLRKVLPINQLSELCNSHFKVSKAYKMAKKHSLNSRLEVYSLSDNNQAEFFAKLGEFESDLTPDRKPYFISYIEVASDLIYESRQQAKKALDLMIKEVRKKWSNNYDVVVKCTSRCLYLGLEFGSKKQPVLSYRAYVPPQNSKITGEPCLHCEWVLRGGYQIGQKTGIIKKQKKTVGIKKKTATVKISDLENFPLVEFIKKLDKKYLVFEVLNPIMIGRYLLGRTRCKKSTELETKREQQAGIDFIQIHLDEKRRTYDKKPANKIDRLVMFNTTDLRRVIKKLRGRIISKKGPRTLMDGRILKFNCAKCVTPSELSQCLIPTRIP